MDLLKRQIEVIKQISKKDYEVANRLDGMRTQNGQLVSSTQKKDSPRATSVQKMISQAGKVQNSLAG